MDEQKEKEMEDLSRRTLLKSAAIWLGIAAIGYAIGINPATSIFGSLVLSVLYYILEVSKHILKDIHDLWVMKAPEIWDSDHIAKGFANSDRVAIQHEEIIQKFIIEFHGKNSGTKGRIGHIFLQNNVNLPMYGRWIRGLIEAGDIIKYETVNLFTPQELLADPDVKKVMEKLKDMPCKDENSVVSKTYKSLVGKKNHPCKIKKRIHILSSLNLRNRYAEWPGKNGRKNADDFADYMIKEYEDFDKSYGGTLSDAFMVCHVFDDKLKERGKHLGEYVLINRHIALRYDSNTKLLEFILGDAPVALYSDIFEEVDDLKDVPPSDTDVNKRRVDWINYLKRNGIAQ